MPPSRSLPIPASPSPAECDGQPDARHGGDLWYCMNCAYILCDVCWEAQPPHRRGGRGRSGLPHEKVDLQKKSVLDAALRLPGTKEELDQLHADDIETTWFGIGKTKDNLPFLADGPILNVLMAKCRADGVVKYPQLVSFVGETNSGKSTLINLLSAVRNKNKKPPFLTPIIGSNWFDREHPTSADVHLYADRSAFPSSRPLLYADCEGTGSGNAIPRAMPERKPRRVALAGGKSREIEWAKTTNPGKTYLRTRSYAVEQLYPRILYAFSDVMVFVLRNVRAIESSLVPLLRWGSASIETSVDQPALPHVIVALNAVDVHVHSGKWGLKEVTDRILDLANESLKHPFISELAAERRQSGVRIETIRDLLHSYYSSFTVVMIPEKSNYNILYDQISILSHCIDRCREMSHEAKRETRMLSTSDEMGIYVQLAFDHFVGERGLITPFDFIGESLKLNPIPRDFGDHLMQLILAVQRARLKGGDRAIFKRLTPVLASTLILDCTRRNTKGFPSNHFSHYRDFFLQALNLFSHKYSRCEFRNGNDRCMVNKATHDTKGHQNKEGRRIGRGKYQSELEDFSYRDAWISELEAAVTMYQTMIKANVQEDREDGINRGNALKLHSQELDSFYKLLGGAFDYRSNSSCLCCLMDTPHHPLPCGHAICSSCIKDYGVRFEYYNYILKNCPLHFEDSVWDRNTVIIRFKPDLASPRVLSLDGGGIRGIVELEVLSAIQKAMGDGIPIQACFDLIVGTGTAGWIAIALGKKHWSVDKCMKKFRELTTIAYQKRGYMSSIDHIFAGDSSFHNPKYKTQPLLALLRSELGEGSFFGSEEKRGRSYETKIAVVAANEDGTRATLIPNYNRRFMSEDKGSDITYEFLRVGNPYDELRTWEAAAATTATQGLYKPFFHERTERKFLDGALYSSNPAPIAQKECDMIWPEMKTENQPLDIFLSIGTSQNLAVSTGVRLIGGEESLDQMRTDSNDERDIETRLRGAQRRQEIPKIKRMDSILDAEMVWKSVLDDLPATGGETLVRRFIRINPDCRFQPPAMDAELDQHGLQMEIRKVLSTNKEQSNIDGVARRLIANTFYFHVNGIAEIPKNRTRYRGFISCRLDREFIHFLGHNLKERQQNYGRNLHFQIWEVRSDSNGYDDVEKYNLAIDDTILDRMIRDQVFDMDSFAIEVSSPTAIVAIALRIPGPRKYFDDIFPISGFPTILNPNKIPYSALTGTSGSRSESPPPITSAYMPPRHTSPPSTAMPDTHTLRNQPPAAAAAASDEMRHGSYRSTSPIERPSVREQPPAPRPKEPQRLGGMEGKTSHQEQDLAGGGMRSAALSAGRVQSTPNEVIPETVQHDRTIPERSVSRHLRSSSNKTFTFDTELVNSVAYRRVTKGATSYGKEAENDSVIHVENFAGRLRIPDSHSQIERVLDVNAFRPSTSPPTSSKSKAKSLQDISPTIPVEFNSRDQGKPSEIIQPRLQMHQSKPIFDNLPTGVENYTHRNWAATTSKYQQSHDSSSHLSRSASSDADSEYLSHSGDEYSIVSAPTIPLEPLNAARLLETTIEVVNVLAQRLHEDETLNILCRISIQDGIVNKIRLQRNLRRLLQHFSTHLNLEADTETEHLLVRILRERSSSISTEFCHRAFNQLPINKEARELNTNLSLTDTQSASGQPIDKGKSKMTSPQWSMEQNWHSNTAVFNPNPVNLAEAKAIQYGFHVERGSTAKNTNLDLSGDSADMKFMLSSSAIQNLRVGLHQFLYPGYKQMLDGLKLRILKWKHTQPCKEDLGVVLNDLKEVDPQEIRISYIENRLSLVDHLKNLIEEITSEEWEWWPLSQPRRTIKEGEAKISWTCGCGDERWAIVPHKFARILSRIVDRSLMQNAEQCGAFNDLSAASSNMMDSAGALKRQTGFANSSQPGASDDRPVSPDPGANTASARDMNLNTVSSGQSPFPGHRGSHNSLTGGVPANTFKEFDTNKPLYVFLVVHVGEDYRLSQLKIEARMTTDDLFHMIRAEYIRLRKPLRRWLSIWGYSHCDFFRFAKFREAEFVPEGIDFPHKKMLDYRFAPRPINPTPPKGPIGRHEFHARFYRCYKPRSLLHLFHKCRKACNSNDAVSLFPKRVKEFEEGGDKREKFWGIYAQERRWFISVVIYNFLCMLPSIIFAFLWLFVWDHPADLQGATVPLVASLALLSLFWGYIITADNRL